MRTKTALTFVASVTKLRYAILAGASVFAIAIPAPAQATPGQPAGPCNEIPTTNQSAQQCQSCLSALSPPANRPPLTPHEAATIKWNCGEPGAPNPADVPVDANGK